MSRILSLAFALLILPVISAQAANPAPASTTYNGASSYRSPATVSSSYDTYGSKQPDLISFGAGYFDFDKSEGHKQSADFRLEYRWGLSMLPLLSTYFNSWDKYVQFHPYAGIEATTLGAVYGNGGWAMDWYICKHAVFTWSEGVGAFYHGDMARLGSWVEFRSMAELGYRFDDESRLSLQISHISNANITKYNPGAEIVGIYYHVPVASLFGR